MELQQLSCCGIFELADIGDGGYEDEEVWNEARGEYEWKPVSRTKAISECKTEIRYELGTIQPRNRLVFATTVAGMGIAEAALRSLRFRVARRFTNGNTGNRITVWMKLVR